VKGCCQSKLQAVLVLLKIRDDQYKKLEEQFEREHKTMIGDMERMAAHTSVISYRKELKTVKEMIEMLIKEGV
jgi:hypothetical protein